jgi:hypothetical protein
MNSKTKILLLFCVQLFICSCWLDDYDDGKYYIKEPYYINKSGVPVKIYMEWVSEYSMYLHNYSYGYIQNGDTLHRTFQEQKFSEDTAVFYFPNDYWNTPSTSDNCGLVYGFYCKNPFFITLQFLDEPTSCLVYSGPVQNSPADIRSWKAYEKGDTIPSVDSKKFFVHLFYTITPEHKAMAKEEDCQVSD